MLLVLLQWKLFNTITLVQIETDYNGQMITIRKSPTHAKSLLTVIWNFTNTGQFDQLITFSVIILCDFRCIWEIIIVWLVEWALLNVITLGPRQTDSINRTIPLTDTHIG